MNSWCKDFADVVFPAINEKHFSVLYSQNKSSRPNTPVNFIVGALMLKENNNLNNDELMESICWDLRYQYALYTTHLQEQPVSDRTFSRFRKRLYHYELETGRNLLKEEMMHRLGNEELIPKELIHYLDPDDYNNVIYYCKGEDAVPRLEKALLEAAQVKVIMNDDVWHEFQEYKLLIRV